MKQQLGKLKTPTLLAAQVRKTFFSQYLFVPIDQEEKQVKEEEKSL